MVRARWLVWVVCVVVSGLWERGWGAEAVGTAPATAAVAATEGAATRAGVRETPAASALMFTLEAMAERDRNGQFQYRLVIRNVTGEPVRIDGRLLDTRFLVTLRDRQNQPVLRWRDLPLEVFEAKDERELGAGKTWEMVFTLEECTPEKLENPPYFLVCEFDGTGMGYPEGSGMYVGPARSNVLTIMEVKPAMREVGPTAAEVYARTVEESAQAEAARERAYQEEAQERREDERAARGRELWVLGAGVGLLVVVVAWGMQRSRREARESQRKYRESVLRQEVMLRAMEMRMGGGGLIHHGDTEARREGPE